MKHEPHNPQNLTPDQYDGPGGFRLLSPVEIATLTDPQSAKTPAGFNLLKHLSPSFYSQASCRWETVNTEKPQTLSVALSYRTEAAELEEVPAGAKFHALPLACSDFVESFNYLAEFHHELMKSKGFWNGERELIGVLTELDRPDLVAIAIAAFDGQKIALHGSELGECLEGLRHGNPPDDKIPEFLSSAAELADVLLRIMDHGHARGWNIAEAVVAKMKMNATRANLHGKNF